VRLPDPQRSRAVLIGTGTYADRQLPDLPVVGRTISDLAEALTDPEYGVVAENYCTVLGDQGDIRQLGHHLISAARAAEDLLLVYFVGHGLVDSRRHELYLGLPDSEWAQPEFNSLEYDKLRSAVLDSAADTKIIILDCCFSGRAVSEAMADPVTEMVGQIEIAGTYVLASAGRDQVALILPGEDYTAFTGRLLGLLRNGVPGGPELLTVDDLYHELMTTMTAAGLSRPQKRGTLTADLLPLAKNRALFRGVADTGITIPRFAQPQPALAVPTPDDDHYRRVVEETDNLVVFLGADVNADDREGPYRQGSPMLPDDLDLANYLASKIGLSFGRWDLAEIAQYVRVIRGEPNVFRWAGQILKVDSEPSPVHRYLAHFPRRLEELGLERRYLMIVTSKFDAALEQAFRLEGEPFDVAIYMAPGTEYEGKFVHLSWAEDDPRPVLTPIEYNRFPIVGDNGELTRTVIVRINGAINDPMVGYRWKGNLMITEDHYLDYLRQGSAEEVVPMQILAKLREASCLFIGYTVANWRLRAFLRLIWPAGGPAGATHWAVEYDPGIFEQQYWRRDGIDLYKSTSTDYVMGLDRFLDHHRDELT
jgi:hypothetical protein